MRATIVLLLIVVVSSAHNCAVAVAQEPKRNETADRSRSKGPATQGPTEKEQKQILTKVLANPLISARIKEHKSRVIRVYRGLGDPATTLEKYQQASITAIVFDYMTNKATRYVIETATGNLVSEQILTGRPQSSEDEVQAATNIIKSDPDLAKLLQAGSKVVGGFIVDGPVKSSPDHRFIQMRIVTADMRRTEKVVVVDLTSDSIASK